MTEVLVQPVVHGKLASLRRGLRARLAAEGAAWLALAAAAAVLLTLGIDWLLRLERPQRVGMAAIVLAALAWVVWRQLIRPLRARMSDEALALLVERRHKALGDRLISAIQFEKTPPAAGLSRAMIHHASAQANTMMDGVAVGELIERRALRRTAMAALCAAMLLGGLWAWQTDVMNLWFRRNVLLASDAVAAWPQKTYITIEGADADGVFNVVRGDDLKVRITVEGQELPDSLTLHAKYPSVGRTQEELKPQTPDRRVYLKVFEAVSEPMEFYVTGGDDNRSRRRPCQVRLIDPPSLTELKLTIVPPAYMNRPPVPVDGSGGTVSAPAGSRVEFSGAATKNLSNVRVMIDDVKAGGGTIELRRQESGPALPRGVRGTFVIPGANKSAARSLRFELTDSDGHINRRGAVCTLAVQADLAPNIELKRHAIGTRITPGAVVPLIADIKDDCGLQSAFSTVSVQGRTGEPATQPVEISPPGTRAFATVRPGRLGEAPPEGKPHLVDLRPRQLKPGEIVTIDLRATDSMPPELGGPNTGRSNVIDLKVVKPDELKDELSMRQKALAGEFIQALSLQEDARAKTAAAAASIGDGIPPELSQQLLEGSRMQATVASQTARVSDVLASIGEEMLYNDLLGTKELAELKSLVISLEALQKPMMECSALLNGARQVTDAAEVKKQTEQIASVQLAIKQQMQELLAKMQTLERVQEVVRLLQDVLNWSQGLGEGIQKAVDRDTGAIFSPTTTKPTSEPAGPSRIKVE